MFLTVSVIVPTLQVFSALLSFISTLFINIASYNLPLHLPICVPLHLFVLPVCDHLQQSLILSLSLLTFEPFNVFSAVFLELMRVHRILMKFGIQSRMLVPHTLRPSVVLMILHVYSIIDTFL